MKDLKLLGKIRSMIKRDKGGDASSSFFSQKMKQPQYTNTVQNPEVGEPKKRLLRRWLDRRRQPSLQKDTRAVAGKGERRFFKPLRLVLLTAMLLVVVFLSGPVVSMIEDWRYFRINEIEISGCRVTNVKALKQFAGINYEMNMLTLDSKALKQRLQNHSWVATAEIRRIWPDSLLISVREYQPEAMIVQGDDKSLHYMDGNGVIFAPVTTGQETDFPVITGLDGFTTGEKKKEMMRMALSFLSMAKRNNPNLPAQDVSELHFTETGEMVLYLVEHPFPIYFGRKGVKRKFYQLRKVLEVLYRKQQGSNMIDKIAYIRMDYQDNKVLVVQKNAG